ncbi:MAG: hypothetical protein ACTSPB_17590 [Candidatus Thorarchaeota archaeon]
MRKFILLVGVLFTSVLICSSVVGITLTGLFGIARDWDVNRDGVGNYQDTGAVALVYGSDPYDGREDVNDDAKVNYLDTGEVALHYGEGY